MAFFIVTVCGLWLLQTLSLCVCVCVCLCACPAFTAYISLTMGRILIKHGENVGTSAQLIVLKFEHSAAKGNNTHKGKHFFHHILCYSSVIHISKVIWATYFIFGTNT